MEDVKKEVFSKDIIVNVNDYNGPLEFLYQLIIERKKNILDISVLDIANAFIEYIKKNIELIEIDSITDSLLMVTHLIELKSKKLLPVHENDKNVDSEIERDKFIQRILMYKKFKDIIPHLEERFNSRKMMMTSEDDDHDQSFFETEVIEELPNFVSPNKLLKAMQNVYKEINDRKKFQSIVNIGIKELSIDDITNQMLDIILKNQDNNEITLKLLLMSIPEEMLTKQYFAVSFVAILVLTRNGLIELYQDIEKSNDIYIKIINLELTYELESASENKGNKDIEISENENDE